MGLPGWPDTGRCRFLLGLGKPLLLYAGLPVMWDVREEDREGGRRRPANRVCLDPCVGLSSTDRDLSMFAGRSQAGRGTSGASSRASAMS